MVVVNVLYALRGYILASRPYRRVVAHPVAANLPSLSIVVPARNEERQIERCVRSLLAQEHPNFELIVVDDCSDDGTPAILDRIASEDARLRVVSGRALPQGWVGKPWALVQGTEIARGTWLLFTDADTVHHPAGAAAVHEAAVAAELDVLSVLTEQELGSITERALMPSFFLAILGGTGAIGDVENPAKADAALFNGQYIMTSRTAYDAVGGHASVRGEIAEDLELARRFKRDGRFRIALAGSEGVATTRMYRSLAEIWNGFTKNFALGLRGRPLWGALGIAILAGVSPLAPIVFVADAVTGHELAALATAGGMGAVAGVVAYQARLMRLPPLSVLWFWLGTAFTVVVLLWSMLLFASGRGVVWRGRRYSG